MKTQFLKISLKIKDILLGCCVLIFFSFHPSHAVNFPNKTFEDGQLTIPTENDDQTITIKGTVVSEDDGMPIPGVNIFIKDNTNTGTTTDFDGKYSINVSSRDAILVFSYIGFVTQEIAVSSGNVIDVTMKADAQELGDVIVVGYGTQKKETLTGSVVQVEGEEITKSPSANITASLQGRLPGLTSSQRSGEPGRDDTSILIRGNGTLGDNSPLIIIDGVERSLLGRLNPEDVESISVLKDASAAIYGARAANGVILVTTKKGKIGKPQFSFSYNGAFNSPTKIPDMLDAPTYAQVYNEGDFYRQGRPDNYTPFYSNDAIQKFRDGSDPILYPNTDWIDAILKPYSFQERMNLQVTGGSEAVRYLLSFGSVTQDGNYYNNPTDYKQYNVRAKIDVNINKNLSIGANVSAIPREQKYSTVDTWIIFNNALIANPTLPAKYPNGLIAPGRLGENPLLLDQRGYNKTLDSPFYSSFTASYKVPFVEGLKLDASYNYDLSNQFQKVFNLPYYYYEYNVNTQEYDKKQGTGASTVELTDTYRRWVTRLYNFRITYDKTFNNHHVAVMVGHEQQKNTFSWASAYRKNFVSPAIDQINAGSSDPEDKNNGGSASASAYNNYFGRINYDFESKYLFEFLFRYNGSQNFPKDKRYGFFPGVSAGWRLSEEEFFKKALPFVNNLKIRATYGEVGNDRVDPYQYLQSFSFGNNYVFGGSDVPGIYANTMPNKNITWEVSKKNDYGLEASLWNGLLGLDFTYFTEKRSDILAARNLSIPAILGFSGLPSENIGKVNNHGIEIAVNHRSKINELTYSVNANMSFVRSEIIYMDETPPQEAYQAQTGHPIGSSLIYLADGIFNTQEELDAYPHANGTQLGDIKIVDRNNDGEINSRDQIRFDKSATPEIVFGLNMDFAYHNFDLNIFFQGQTNAYNYDSTFASLGTSNFDNGFVERAANRWTVDNPNGTMPRADAFQPGTTNFFLYDATFVRLKSLELGWTVPERIISKAGINGVRFYVSGFNLLTWAKEITWADPELNGNSLYYPQQRTLNLGVNVKF